MSSTSSNSIQDRQVQETFNNVQKIQQNNPLINNSMTPLDDPQYLFKNAHCYQYLREFSNKRLKQKSEKKDEFQITSQFLFGCYMPPYCSVLNSTLMEKWLLHVQYPNNIIHKTLSMHTEIIGHEQESFKQWLSTNWEENLKNRRLTVIPHIENFTKSACNFSNDYIKSHYNGSYRSKMKIDYDRDESEVTNKIEMIYNKRVKITDLKHTFDLPKINITNLESKLSFTDGLYIQPQKLPFVKDELCRILSKKFCSHFNLCLSSIKHIMNLEKPNSLWLIPVNVDIDTEGHKTVFIGGALSTGHFSQEEKSCYYLRKEIKKKFRKLYTTPYKETVKDYSQYNYDSWTLKCVDGVNDDVTKSFNLLIRNKPHGIVKTKNMKKVLIPKVEYQPEFGFEKVSDEQFIEYWLDTYFRAPYTQMILVSVQYNMDIMMIKHKNVESRSDLDEKKQVCLKRLYHTLDKLTQLDKGEYIMLHNPKKPFQVELYQSSIYGGFNLLNMYLVLQQTEVSNSLTWNPIDAEIVCPIHEHFKVAPCMFKPNSMTINLSEIGSQVKKFKTILENKDKFEKQKMDDRKKIKKEKNKIRLQLKRENDVLYQIKKNSLLTKDNISFNKKE